MNNLYYINKTGKYGKGVFAFRDIKKDEEILYDYSSVWFEGFKCMCGKPNCRKYVSDFLTIPQEVKEKYIKLGIVPKFIMKKIKS